MAEAAADSHTLGPVTFHLPSDPDYLKAKRIRTGEEQLDPRFDTFVERFHVEFGAPPLALGTDSVARADGTGNMPRLGVVLERSEQFWQFVVTPFCNYDPEKQATTARLFVESTDGVDLRSVFGLPRRSQVPVPWASEIFVYFQDFERMARWEACEGVQGEELEAFVQ